MSNQTSSGQDKAAEQAFYDRLFSERKRFDQFQEEVYAQIARDAREGATGDVVLDLGCGSGTQAVNLLGQGFTVIAADLSIEAVKLARRTVEASGNQAYFLNADAERLPLADASLDSCVCSLLWHHFTHLEHIAAELARVLKPGASLVAIDSNAHNPFAFLFMNVVNKLKPLSGLTVNQRAIGTREIRKTFGRHGFEGFRFASITTELKRDWLGKSLGASLNYHMRRTVLGLSRLLLPQICHGNILYSVLKRSEG
jgi:ubiquinone/menaquinone biosynthesis C-methylase UbiE